METPLNNSETAIDTPSRTPETPFALKGQITAGDITKFENTGGEPLDIHMTWGELDPCPPEIMKVLESTPQDIVERLVTEFGPTTTIGDIINWALDKVIPHGILKDMIPGEARLQIRKMDSDGRI